MNWTTERYGGLVLMLVMLFDFGTTWAGGVNLFDFAFPVDEVVRSGPNVNAILFGGILAIGVFVALIVLPPHHGGRDGRTISEFASVYLLFALIVDVLTSFAGVFAFFGESAFHQTTAALTGNGRAMVAVLLVSAVSMVMLWATVFFPILLGRTDDT